MAECTSKWEKITFKEYLKEFHVKIEIKIKGWINWSLLWDLSFALVSYLSSPHCAYGDFQAVNGQNINNCFPPSCQQWVERAAQLNLWDRASFILKTKVTPEDTCSQLPPSLPLLQKINIFLCPLPARKFFINTDITATASFYRWV